MVHLMKDKSEKQNPLLRSGPLTPLPDFPVIKPVHVMPALEELLQNYQQGMEALLNSGAGTGWSLVESEAAWADELDRAWSPVSHLNSVTGSKKLRKAFNEGLERLTEHENWRQQHPGIFQAYQELSQSADFVGPHAGATADR